MKREKIIYKAILGMFLVVYLICICVLASYTKNLIVIITETNIFGIILGGAIFLLCIFALGICALIIMYLINLLFRGLDNDTTYTAEDREEDEEQIRDLLERMSKEND